MNQRELLDIINIIRDKADNGKLVVLSGLEYHEMWKVCQVGMI